MSQTHFGFESVEEQEKARRVRGVFDSVASKYDVMNDLMSLGVHRVWKRIFVSDLNPRPRDCLLDLAGGTGDIRVVHTDINAAMLSEGRNRLLDAGVALPTLVCDAEKLPFPDASFDLVTVAFGLRNMTHKDVALKEMHRVLKPMGKLLVLEFSKVAKPLEKADDWYSFKVLPLLGKWVANDDASYRYLAESIRMHPDQNALKTMMHKGGFGHVDYHNLSGGMVALHVAIKC